MDSFKVNTSPQEFWGVSQMQISGKGEFLPLASDPRHPIFFLRRTRHFDRMTHDFGSSVWQCNVSRKSNWLCTLREETRHQSRRSRRWLHGCIVSYFSHMVAPVDNRVGFLLKPNWYALVDYLFITFSEVSPHDWDITLYSWVFLRFSCNSVAMNNLLLKMKSFEDYDRNFRKWS